MFCNFIHNDRANLKALVKATTILSSRMDYLLYKDDENIKIEEITQIELALGESLGALCNRRFPNIKLNNEIEYQNRLEELKKYNRQANDRRKINYKSSGR